MLKDGDWAFFKTCKCVVKIISLDTPNKAPCLIELPNKYTVYCSLGELSPLTKEQEMEHL